MSSSLNGAVRTDRMFEEPPSKLAIYCHKADGLYVFTSNDLRGLHIVDDDLKAAYERLKVGINLLAGRVFGDSVKYKVSTSYRNLERMFERGQSNLPKYVGTNPAVVAKLEI